MPPTGQRLSLITDQASLFVRCILIHVGLAATLLSQMQQMVRDQASPASLMSIKGKY
jgi:hypothetical protein